MDIEKTKQYYNNLTNADICDCKYCQNYVREVKAAYPELTDHLREIGVDIEKPFEAIPIGPADGVMYYSGAQYVVMGTGNDFRETSVGDVCIFITDSHPMTGIEEEHFVIEISPIYLNRWIGESHDH